MPAISSRLVPVVLIAAILVGVSGCAGSPAPDESASDPASPTGASATSEPAPEPTQGPAVAAGDICALLTEAEVTGVLGAAYPASLGTFGSLGEPTGGQCVWTDDPNGDPYTDDASTLELIAFVPSGPNPPPAEAPALGSTAIVPDITGAWFASTDHVFWIRVAGALSVDATAVEAARALIPAVLSRL